MPYRRICVIPASASTSPTALTRRLRRNYIWMYAILLLAWVLKITSPKLAADGAPQDTPISPLLIFDNAALGPLPGWIVIPLIVAFYVMLVVACLRRHKRADDDEVRV